MKNHSRLILCILGCGVMTVLFAFSNTSCMFDGGSCERNTVPSANMQMYQVAPNARSQRSPLGGVTLTYTGAPPTELPTGQVAANSTEVPVYEAIEDALGARHKVDPKTGAKVIVMSSLDSGYVEMGLNLWETSFLKFGIENYLFVCTDKQARLDLAKHGLSCFQGKEIKGADKASAYGSAAFARKTHLKTEITLQALRLGYTVLLVDVDIVFLKNPFPYFTCDDCDLQIQSDGVEINSGFFLVKPTQAAIELHEKALQMAHKTKLSNQKTLARTLEKMVKNKTIKVKMLSDKEFPRGLYFFEGAGRMFGADMPCEECVIVHNNWIHTLAAKEYRFKEFWLWLRDHHGYYSDVERRYITYSNPVDFGVEDTIRQEIEALRSAFRIGYLLNRTVILPNFHCYGFRWKVVNRCSLNTYVQLTDFDEYLGDHYREHMFLDNPKVPSVVRESRSPLVHIASRETHHRHTHNVFVNQTPDVMFRPADKISGATSAELREWLEPFAHHSVLRFHSLYNAFSSFSESDDGAHFEVRLSSGFKEADYRQHTRLGYSFFTSPQRT